MCDAHLRDLPVRVAVIDPAVVPNRPLVRWHELSPDESGPIPRVSRLRWVGGRTADLPASTRKTVRRQENRLRRFTQGSCSELGGMFLGEIDGQYSGLMFGQTHPGEPRHHIAARGLTDLLPDLTDYRHVRIVTGMCLFGAAGLRFSAPDGTTFGWSTIAGTNPLQVDAVHVHPNLTLYELEMTQRITAELRWRLTGLHTAAGRPDVILDMPRIQYYGHLIDSYRTGRISRRLLLRCWHHVDHRHRHATKALRSRVRLAAIRAGQPDTRITESPGLDCAESVLRTAILDGWPAGAGPDPEQRLVNTMITALLQSRDGSQWRRLLEHTDHPTTVTELAFTSYVWQLIRPSLLDQHTDRATLTIMLDDIAEQQLYTAARDALTATTAARPGLAPHSLAGIFPLTRLFHAGQAGTKRLYDSVHAHTFVTESGRELTSQQLATEVTHGSK